MTKYVIHGGKPLFGEIDISGAKNAAVAIIPAALLVDGVCRIENLPQISDVTLLLNILQELGEELKSFSRSRQQKNQPFETPKESRKREAPEEHTEHDRRSSGGERTAKSPLGFLQGIFGHKPSSPPPSTSRLPCGP